MDIQNPIYPLGWKLSFQYAKRNEKIYPEYGINTHSREGIAKGRRQRKIQITKYKWGPNVSIILNLTVSRDNTCYSPTARQGRRIRLHVDSGVSVAEAISMPYGYCDDVTVMIHFSNSYYLSRAWCWPSSFRSPSVMMVKFASFPYSPFHVLYASRRVARTDHLYFKFQNYSFESKYMLK